MSTHETDPSHGPIVFWNRAEKREETELVYGDAGIRFLYGTLPGQKLADWLLSTKPVSRLYGAYQAASVSRAKVEPFIRKFGIPMGEYEVPAGGFGSFNDFFIRKFKPGKRVFAADPGRMPAFSEARYLAWEKVTDDQLFPVKGSFMTAEMILCGPRGTQSVPEAARAHVQDFAGGPLVIARLCPVDYHRYHYPDAGRTLASYAVAGKLHSVNPAALRYSDGIFATNERRVSILETRNFGKLAYVEVGAMMVGKIVQTHPEDRPFARGDEKGYFLFGGSTVIVLGQPGAWKPDSDILEQAARRRETYVKLGDAICGLY
jgi:phosphatidylserine decarboxylase